MIWCFELPFFVLYRSSGVLVDSDQNLPEDLAPVEVVDQSTSQDKVPEGTVVVEAPEQVSKPTVELDPLVVLTPSAEVDASKGPQQVRPMLVILLNLTSSLFIADLSRIKSLTRRGEKYRIIKSRWILI